jgi:hypothetical protein
MVRVSQKLGRVFQPWVLGLPFAVVLSCQSSLTDIGAVGVGGSSGGWLGLGGSLGSGGKITLPIGSGGRGTGGNGASTGGAPAMGTLAVCEVPGGPSRGAADQSLEIDDFDDGDGLFQGNGLNGSWFGYTDDSANGLQVPTASDVLPEEGGVGSGGYALHVRGQGFNDWGSGFVGQFAADASDQACLFDASAYAGVTFWIQGTIEPDPSFDGMAYDPGLARLLIVEKDVIPLAEGGNCDAPEGRCWDSHRKTFTVDDCWRRYSFRFEELLPDGFGFDGGELDLDELSTINFELGRGNRYDLWIDEVSFFIGDPPVSDPICSDAGGEAGAGPVPG